MSSDSYFIIKIIGSKRVKPDTCLDIKVNAIFFFTFSVNIITNKNNTYVKFIEKKVINIKAKKKKISY